MGRRKNNPGLVQELINGRWTMPQDEFEEKYASLSSSDMSRVSDVIHNMWAEVDEEDEDDDDGEGLSVYDAALIWASNGKDEDYTFGFTEEELEEAL